MAAPQDADVLKIGLMLPSGYKDLYQLNYKNPLSVTIREICEKYSLDNSEVYSLAWLEPKHGFITEKNKKEIYNGDFLKLVENAQKQAHKILDKLNYGTETERIFVLGRLTDLSPDLTFASEFIQINGHLRLISMVEGGLYKGEVLSLSLKALLELMEHGIVSWETLSDRFVGQVAMEINKKVSSEANIVESALAVLEFLVMNCPHMYAKIEKVITIPNIVVHLKWDKPEVQKNTIAFINALFLKSDSTRENISGTLSNSQIKKIIHTSVIHGRKVGAEMSHQLYVLQSLLLNSYENKINEELTLDNYEVIEKIAFLADIIINAGDFDSTSTTSRESGSDQQTVYFKLGFENLANPVEDFLKPPGKLALDNLVYFAKNHPECFVQLIQNNNFMTVEHVCPLAKTSIRLTRILCEILKIGETPAEEGKSFYPMFFTHDHPFEELFCVCVQLVSRTWRQMKAALMDFENVLGVVREQILRTLNAEPAPISFSDFKVQVRELSYNKIVKIRQEEFMNRDELAKQTRPIKELQVFFTPEILEIIKRQRLRYLCEGTTFVKYSSKGSRAKDRFWYCRLSPNHNALHYGDCDENAKPPLETLPRKLLVNSISYLVTGRKCPHVRDIRKGHKLSVTFAFSLILADDNEPLNFVAPSEKIFCYWTDAINILIGGEMKSKEAHKELEVLMDMKIRMQLLETQGVQIPENPPPIPDDPPDYNFRSSFFPVPERLLSTTSKQRPY